MKKIWLVTAILLCLSLGLIGCGGEGDKNDPSDSSGSTDQTVLYLSCPDQFTVNQYDVFTINASATGGASGFVWSADNDNIRWTEVAGGIQVTAEKMGQTNLTVTVANLATKTVTITVEETIYFPVLVLSQTQAEPKVGGEIRVGATVTLNGREVEAVVTFESANQDIATVEGGVIKGIAAGETVITVTAEYSGETIYGQIAVHVK